MIFLEPQMRSLILLIGMFLTGFRLPAPNFWLELLLMPLPLAPALLPILLLPVRKLGRLAADPLFFKPVPVILAAELLLTPLLLAAGGPLTWNWQLQQAGLR